MISSPGSISSAPIIATKPEVHEFTAIQCFISKYSETSFSKFLTSSPPSNPSPLEPKKPDNLPDSSTLLAALISSFPIVLYAGNSFLITGVPP